MYNLSLNVNILQELVGVPLEKMKITKLSTSVTHCKMLILNLVGMKIKVTCLTLNSG